MGNKVVNTRFGKRKAFCGCEVRLTKERDEYLNTIIPDIQYQTETCTKCGLYPVSFRSPSHAKYYKNLFNKFYSRS